MPLTIGSVAKQADVGIETVRFYEKKGIIEKPPRLDSGYRQYPEDTIDRIRFIKLAQQLGFSLAEIKELLALKVKTKASCTPVKRKAQAKLLEIESKIVNLKRIRKVLTNLTRSCDESESTDDCPILKALEG